MVAAEVVGLVVSRREPPVLEAVEVAGETVVYDSRTRSLHLFDTIGTLVWSALDGARSVDEVARVLTAAFSGGSVAAGDVAAGVTTFVRSLLELDLVEVRESS
jgi:hypothetical protein